MSTQLRMAFSTRSQQLNDDRDNQPQVFQAIRKKTILEFIYCVNRISMIELIKVHFTK